MNSIQKLKRLSWTVAFVLVACGGGSSQPSRTSTLISTSSLQPSNGPSGTIVTIRGQGFSAADSVTFGSTAVQYTVFDSTEELTVVVPFTESNGTDSPYPAGSTQVLINGKLVSTFTVTALPANPNPPGAVLKTVSLALAQRLSLDQTTLSAAIARATSSTTDQNSIAYLQALQQLLPALQQFFQTDFALLLSSANSGELALLEQVLNSEFNPNLAATTISEPQALEQPRRALSAAPGQPLSGDAWLEARQSLIADANLLYDITLILKNLPGVAGLVTALHCSVTGLGAALEFISSDAIDVAVGSYGKVVGFNISDDPTFPASLTLSPNPIKLKPAESKQLYAAIWTASLLSPVQLKTAETAVTLIKDCLVEAVIDSLPQSVRAMAGLAASFADKAASAFGNGQADRPFGQPQGPMPISFGKIYSPPASLKSATPLAHCTVVAADGTATACTPTRGSMDLLDDQWGFHINYHWVARTYESSSTQQVDDFWVTPFAWMDGHVYDVLRGSPISGVVISTDLDSQTAITDASGYFFLQTNTGAAPSPGLSYKLSMSGSAVLSFTTGKYNWGDYPTNQIFYVCPAANVIYNADGSVARYCDEQFVSGIGGLVVQGGGTYIFESSHYLTYFPF